MSTRRLKGKSGPDYGSVERDRAGHGPSFCSEGSKAGSPLKKAEQDQATIIWIDEAGFYLLPMAVRTWAPRGQTPVLWVKLTRDHLSAISGITFNGRLFMQVRPAAFDAAFSELAWNISGPSWFSVAICAHFVSELQWKAQPVAQ